MTTASKRHAKIAGLLRKLAIEFDALATMSMEHTPSGFYWTQEADRYVVANYKTMSNEDIGSHLGRTAKAVVERAYKTHGLSKK